MHGSRGVVLECVGKLLSRSKATRDRERQRCGREGAATETYSYIAALTHPQPTLSCDKAAYEYVRSQCKSAVLLWLCSFRQVLPLGYTAVQQVTLAGMA